MTQTDSKWREYYFGNITEPMFNIEKLHKDVSTLINESKTIVAYTVNSALTILYWKVGDKIRKDLLKNKRAEYGTELISSLSNKLTNSYGKGWSKQHLWNYLYTVEIFPDLQILSTLSRVLSWSHIKELIYIKDDNASDGNGQKELLYL